MKLIVAVIQGEDAPQTVAALASAGFSVTRMASSGGFLQQGNVTLMVGTEPDRVEQVLGVLRENCSERSRYMTPMQPMVEPGEFFMPYPVEVQVGGATVWVVNVDKFEKL